MVLAAGLGTRLWPLTADRGKPAVPFFGRPLIEGIAEWLEANGFSRCVVNTHHRPESIHRALAKARIDVAFSHEDTILGTAGCLERACARGLLSPERPTLIVNGKLFTDIDLGPVLDTHRRTKAAVTMVLKPNATRARFREVLVKEDRVVGFGPDRTPAGPSPLLFTGIHVVSPEVLATIPPGESDTIRDVYPPFIRSRRVVAHVDEEGRWLEFSTLARYLELHGDAVVRSEGATVDPGAEVARAVLWENARVEAGAAVEEAILMDDVVIRAGERIERSVVALRSVAGDGRGRVLGDRLVVPIYPERAGKGPPVP